MTDHGSDLSRHAVRTTRALSVDTPTDTLSSRILAFPSVQASADGALFPTIGRVCTVGGCARVDLLTGGL